MQELLTLVLKQTSAVAVAVAAAAVVVAAGQGTAAVQGQEFERSAIHACFQYSSDFGAAADSSFGLADLR